MDIEIVLNFVSDLLNTPSLLTEKRQGSEVSGHSN